MVPVLVMWNGNNVGGTVKRGTALAMQIGFGNCGGVIASFMYVLNRPIGQAILQYATRLFECDPY